MWIKSLSLVNIRSFESPPALAFSKKINLIVGPNNSGKSTIILALLGLQDSLPQLSRSDIRAGTHDAKVDIELGDCNTGLFQNSPQLSFTFHPQGQLLIYAKAPQAPAPTPARGLPRPQSQPLPKAPASEPQNFIYPYLSGRKVTQLTETFTGQAVRAIPPTLENLNAKIDRLTSPQFLPGHTIYMKGCDAILGLPVTSTHTDTGKRAAYEIPNIQSISLLAMGAGVMNALGLLANLAVAVNKVFLIEEPETDIHPKALKALLDLIIDRSEVNQFIVTTHSNIVLKYLGSLPDSKIFRVDITYPERIPTSTIKEVGTSFDERRAILDELGYELYDNDMYNAWLFLEESSAERIIKGYLIPWFVPQLKSRLRTYSAHSISEVTPKFRDFNNLFVFLNLQAAYRNRAWVLIDAGEAETKIITDLKTTYKNSGWDEDHFRQLSRHDFEDFYPDRFKADVQRCKAISDKHQKQEQKKALLGSVEEWISKNPVEAEEAFARSASEIIEILKEIQSTLSP